MPSWKPSRMPPGCSQATPSCEPGAFNSRGSTGPLSIVPGCPRARSRLISRAPSKSLCTCTTIVGAFRKSVRCSIQKLGNHPEPSQRKQRKELRKEHAVYAEDYTEWTRRTETAELSEDSGRGAKGRRRPRRKGLEDSRPFP